MNERINNVSNIIIEFIEQILSGEDIVNGNMDFGYHNINDKNMCTIDIYIKENNIERHINTGISSYQIDEFYEKLFNELYNRFLEHDTIGISKSYSIQSKSKDNYQAISILNSNGSEIHMNFIHKSLKFDNIINDYNKKIDDYVDILKVSSKNMN